MRGHDHKYVQKQLRWERRIAAADDNKRAHEINETGLHTGFGQQRSCYVSPTQDAIQ